MGCIRVTEQKNGPQVRKVEEKTTENAKYERYGSNTRTNIRELRF